MREEFKEKEEASYKIVDRYMAKLENQLPKMFSQMASELIAHAEKEIDDSNKWFDVHQCQAYISPIDSSPADDAFKSPSISDMRRFRNEQSTSLHRALRATIRSSENATAATARQR